jgi:hypothetical protein
MLAFSLYCLALPFRHCRFSTVLTGCREVVYGFTAIVIGTAAQVPFVANCQFASVGLRNFLTELSSFSN